MNIVETSKFNVLPPFRWQMSSPTCTAEALAQVMEYAYKMSVGGDWRRFHSYGIYANPKINTNVSSGKGMGVEEPLKLMCSNSAFPSDFIDKDETNLDHWEIVDFYKRKFENNPKALALKDEFVLDGYVNMSKNDYARITNIINNKQDCVAPMLLWVYYYPELTQVGISEDLIVADVKEPDNKPTSTHVVLIIGTATIDGREYYICKDSMWIREDLSIYYMPADWAGIISIHAPIYNKKEFGQPNRSRVNASDIDSNLFKRNNYHGGMNVFHNFSESTIVDSIDVYGNVLVKDVFLDGVSAKDFSVSSYNGDYLTITLGQKIISHNHLSVITDGIGSYSPKDVFSGFVRGAERSGNFIKYRIGGEKAVKEIGFIHHEKDKYGNMVTKYPQTTIPMIVGLDESLKALESKQCDVTSVNGMKGDVIVGGVRTSTIVIANYDSHENSKKGADIVIEKGENASVKINDAIKSLEGIGGEVKLMEGNYNVEYGITVNVDGVHLKGIPNATTLVRGKSWTNNPDINRSGVVNIWRENNRSSMTVSVSNIIVNGVNGGVGFDCHGLSQIINCTSSDSNTHGFRLYDSSQAISCTSSNNSNSGFDCWDSSQAINCTSSNNFWHGFCLYDSSQATNCMSSGNNWNGFDCSGSSQATNCTSSNSGDNGFYCATPFKGICSFNVLKGDRLRNKSSAPAIVEYNAIQESTK